MSEMSCETVVWLPKTLTMLTVLLQGPVSIWAG